MFRGSDCGPMRVGGSTVITLTGAGCLPGRTTPRFRMGPSSTARRRVAGASMLSGAIAVAGNIGTNLIA